MRRLWASVADPAQVDFERLFSALSGRALQGDGSGAPLFPQNLEAWLDANVALATEAGIPRPSPGPTPGSGWR